MSQANQTRWSVHIRCASFTFYMFVEPLFRARDGHVEPTVSTDRTFNVAVDKGNHLFWSHVGSKF